MTGAELLTLAIVALFLLGCVGMVVDVKRHCGDVDRPRRSLMQSPDRSAALSVEPWHGRRVYDFETGSYLGRAEGEPYSDGVEGVIRLRQDEDGQTIKPYALCAFVKLDSPPEVSRG